MTTEGSHIREPTGCSRDDDDGKGLTLNPWQKRKSMPWGFGVLQAKTHLQPLKYRHLNANYIFVPALYIFFVPDYWRLPKGGLL